MCHKQHIRFSFEELRRSYCIQLFPMREEFQTITWSGSHFVFYILKLVMLSFHFRDTNHMDHKLFAQLLMQSAIYQCALVKADTFVVQYS